MITVVMGVSGSGKSTVGRLLAARLGWAFFDADDFHSTENVAKMRSGQPLTDQDRVAWLASLRAEIVHHLQTGRSAVVACSALRRTYRRELRQGDDGIRFVYLQGNFDTIHQRLLRREGHYMPPGLLDSQFKTLEEPEDAIVVSVELSPPEAVEEIVRALDRAAPVSTDAGQATSPRSHGP